VDPETFQRAVGLHQSGKLDEAEQLYASILAAEPRHLGALYNQGVLLHDLRRYEEAVSSYDRALAIQPQAPRILFSRANALGELRRIDEALADFDRAIALDPEFDKAKRNRGILKLLIGDFAGGLVDYEQRRPKDPARRMLPSLTAPDWTGDNLDGRSILVSDATGMGDAIQLVRYLPMLTGLGARVSFMGNAKLFRLFATLAPGVRCVAALEPGEQFDFQCKLLSLPYLFRTELATIPNSVPYLHAEPELVQKWKARIGEHGFKVGVCWKGNPSRSIDAGRSIPLAGLHRLARIPGVRLISLQKRFGLEELETLPESMRVETLGEDFDEGADAFIDSAAVMANLDLMISTCTSLAHLAGALARPTWVALKLVPEWRWQLDREDSPWYPTMRLFRQSQRDQWDPVFDAMTQALAQAVPSA